MDPSGTHWLQYAAFVVTAFAIYFGWAFFNDDSIHHLGVKIFKFWKFLGSKPVIMDADQHDKIFAITSHLPHLIAYNLILTATNFEISNKNNVLRFSAGGLRDFSRIAASNEIMWRDIFFNNKKNMLKVIDNFIKNLKIFKQDIKSNRKNLETKLKNLKKVRQKIVLLKQDTSKPDFGRI